MPGTLRSACSSEVTPCSLKLLLGNDNNGLRRVLDGAGKRGQARVVIKRIGPGLVLHPQAVPPERPG